VGHALPCLSASGVNAQGALHTFDLPAAVSNSKAHQQPANIRIGPLLQETGQQGARFTIPAGLEVSGSLLQDVIGHGFCPSCAAPARAARSSKV
jgi:hypothetical protein